MSNILRFLLLLAGSTLGMAAVAPIVPGYERLRGAGAGKGAEAGEVLLSELSCLACHGARTPAQAPLVWKGGPDLSAAGDRLLPGYVLAYLAQPAASKPGTTMPQVLAGQPETTVRDLAQYVLSLHGKPATAGATVGSAKEGEALFKSIGCIACHAEVPLGTAQKYAPGELVRFLLQPLAIRPAARMPDLHLTSQEAASLAAYLSPEAPRAAAETFVPDGAAAERGHQAFLSLGCANCHARTSETKPVGWINLDRGCLAETPPSGVPHYPLSAEQRAALRAALSARGPERQAPTLEPQAAIKRIMLQRNCFACHQRDGLGGPAPDMAVNFTSTRDDLGDAGRLPPPLDGAGRKFQPVALETILHGKDPVRKYMRVRMGDFGDELAHQLPEFLATADAEKERPMIGQVDASKVGRNEPGRIIVGTTGYACIACHDLHGHASLGIGAYDLAEMPKRLRPEWMRDFLLDPARFPTGARMPAFWPGGKSLNPKLGGDAERQIDAVRVYLTEADQSIPPPGFADSAAYEVKATTRPVVFRTFMAGVGTHAIAVAFPAGVNAAFDAFEGRWSLAWRGRFLDGDGTWNQRVAKMETPLGEDRIELGDSGALSVVEAASSRSPTEPKRQDAPTAAQPRMTFHGYRLEAGGVPVFLYSLGALSVEDRLEPTDSHGLRRNVRITGQTGEQVTFSSHPPKGVTVTPADGTPLEFKNGVAEFTEDISW